MKTFVVNEKEIKVESSEALYKYVTNLYDNKEVRDVTIGSLVIKSPRVMVEDELYSLMNEINGEFKAELITKEKCYTREIVPLLVDELVNTIFTKDVKLIGSGDLKNFIIDFCINNDIDKKDITKIMLFGVDVTNLKDISSNDDLSKKLEEFTTIVSKFVFKTIKDDHDLIIDVYNRYFKEEDKVVADEKPATDTFSSLKEEILKSSDETDKLIEEMRKNIESLEEEGMKLKDTLDNSKKEQTPSYIINYTSSTSWVDDAIAIGTIAVGVAAVGGLAYLAYKYFTKYDDIELEFE